MTATIERLQAARIDAANRLHDADARLRGLLSGGDADHCTELDGAITAAKEARAIAQGESDAAEESLSSALTEERLDSERQSVPAPRPMISFAAHREKYPHARCCCWSCDRTHGHDRCEAPCDFCLAPTGVEYLAHWSVYVCDSEACRNRYEAELAEQARADRVAAWRESRRALRDPRRPQTARY